MATHNQDEIVARILEVEEDDFFGFRREVLLSALDFPHAQPFLAPKADGSARRKDDWDGPEPLLEEARWYLEFAIEKIRDHRGISASRSVEKLREYAWLLGRDDVITAMDIAEYPQYGAPKIRAFAIGMGWPWPTDHLDLNRMVEGLPCVPDCSSGCGLS